MKRMISLTASLLISFAQLHAATEPATPALAVTADHADAREKIFGANKSGRLPLAVIILR